MKKVLITMAVLASMVTAAMVFSSFGAPKQNVKEKCTQIEVDDPRPYWDGRARRDVDYNESIYITVYQAEGACNSFYAVYYENGIDKEVWVKENPDYDRYSSTWWKACKYYVSRIGKNYFFNM